MNQNGDRHKSLSDQKFQQIRSGESRARVSSQDLLAGRPELVIEHNGREYRLRLTQSGKLILTA